MSRPRRKSVVSIARSRGSAEPPKPGKHAGGAPTILDRVLVDPLTCEVRKVIDGQTCAHATALAVHSHEDAILARVLLGVKPWAAIADVTGSAMNYTNWTRKASEGHVRFGKFVERLEQFRGRRQRYLMHLEGTLLPSDVRATQRAIEREFPGDFGDHGRVEIGVGAATLALLERVKSLSDEELVELAREGKLPGDQGKSP